MSKPLKIDFVSDVACPWCIIGLLGLEEALRRIGDAADPEIRFHPFELNPGMPYKGQDFQEHITEKYGITPEQSTANRATIRTRAAALGFDIGLADDSRIYNTFNAHRLLAWAGEQGRQLALKHALFTAYFTEGRNVADHDVLAETAEKAGLDRAAARTVLAGDDYADAVRAEQQLWRSQGINAVPSIIINGRYLISGGHPPETFEQALRRIMAEPDAEIG